MPQAAKQKVVDRLEAGLTEFVENIRDAIRPPSISKTGQGIPEMACMTAAYLRDLGASPKIVHGAITPMMAGNGGG